MALAQEDIREIQQLIAQAHNERPEVAFANVRYELELRERMVRVEEELKHQRELMQEGFKLMDKRFEQVDKRFEQFAKHLELMDKRFDQMQAESNKRFDQMQAESNKRFEQVDKRFDQQHSDIMGLHTEIKQLMRWGVGSVLAVGSLIVAALRFMS